MEREVPMEHQWVCEVVQLEHLLMDLHLEAVVLVEDLVVERLVAMVLEAVMDQV
jgi:hypothetical protein